MSSMALPPDLMAALGGGAGAGAPVDPYADPAAEAAPPSGGGDETKPIELLKQMLDLGKQYLEVEPDEEDKATMTKVLAQLQGYLAKDQKEQDQALSGTMNPRALRKLGA